MDSQSIVMLVIAGMVIYFWRKDKSVTPVQPNTTSNVTVNTSTIPSQGSTGSNAVGGGGTGNPDADAFGISKPYVNPNAANIVTQPATGPTTQVVPNSGGQTYIVQPITVPVGMSPYYYSEATWIRLFNSNSFTNPDVAREIYSRRDPNNPEYW